MPLENGKVSIKVTCSCGASLSVVSGTFGTYCPGCGNAVFTRTYTDEITREMREVIRQERLKMRKTRSQRVLDEEVMSSPLLSVCEDCGQAITADQFFLVGTSLLCRSCYNNLPKCSGCGQKFHKKELKGGLCTVCRESYRVCKRCGATYDARTSKEIEVDGKTYCEHCVTSYNADRDISRHSYGHKPRPIFFGDDEKLHLGVELELDNSSNLQSYMAMAHCDEIYFKSDGSLSCGVETVTHPATLKYHMEKFPWKKILRAAKDAGYRGHTGYRTGDGASKRPTCGLHIHFNKTALDTSGGRDAREAKLLLLVDKFWDNIAIFTRRDAASLKTWACRYSSVKDEKDLGTVLSKAKNEARSVGRRLGVNMMPENTIEFRIFRSTTNYTTLIASIQLVWLLVKATELPTADVQAMTWEDLCARGDHFKEFNAYLDKLRGMPRYSDKI